MKLKHAWREVATSRPISEAVSSFCDDDRDGIAETALASSRKAVEFLGQLVERLHERGLLCDDDILSLLPGWQKAD